MREIVDTSSQTTNFGLRTGPNRNADSAETEGQISYSTLSNESIERIVSRHYKLKTPLKCKLYVRGGNDVYSVSTPRQRFALRVSRSNWLNEAACRSELEALEYIGAHGTLVAIPVRRADGDWITTIKAPEGRRRAVLFGWVNGCAPKLTDTTHAMLCGRHLAGLHEASDDMPPITARPHLDADYLLSCPLELIRPRLEELPSHAAKLEALAERTLGRLSSIKTTSKDWGFCHGDVHAGNVRIDGGRAVSFDFDACGTGWRIYDLASYRWDARRHGVEELAWRPFIEGYLQIRPAGTELLEFVRDFMILRHLWLAGQWIILSDLLGHSLLSEEFFANLVEFCEGIEAGSTSAPQAFFNVRPTQLFSV